MKLPSYFQDDFQRLASDIQGSNARTFLDNLNRWFELLDAEVNPVLSALEDSVDFEQWYNDQTATMGSMVGSGRISWPRDKLKRLAMQLSLFRAFAEGAVAVGDFETYFLRSNDEDVAINEISYQFFRPFSEDFLRLLIRTSDEEFASLGGAPASDRTVTFDHNSIAYRDAVSSVANLAVAIEGANNFPDVETKSEKLAEVRAGLELLRSARVRLNAILTVLGPPMKWLAEKFAGGVISKLAGYAIDNLGKILGPKWLDLL